MKCPYQTITIHEPETFGHYAQKRVSFGDCLRLECPFYYTYQHMDTGRHITEHCKRAESEANKK